MRRCLLFFYLNCGRSALFLRIEKLNTLKSNMLIFRIQWTLPVVNLVDESVRRRRQRRSGRPNKRQATKNTQRPLSISGRRMQQLNVKNRKTFGKFCDLLMTVTSTNEIEGRALPNKVKFLSRT